MIACPNEGRVDKEHVVWIGQTAHDQRLNKRYNLSYNFREAKPIDSNRNLIIKDFLHWRGDYLIFVDSDNPPTRNPIDLVKLDLDIVACPTPIWNAKRASVAGFPIYLNCMDYRENLDGWMEHVPQHGLQEIDAAGSGCLVIAKRVLKKVRPAFKRRWDDDGVASHGSDFEFCRRAKEAGFEVWAHYDYPCHHHKELDLLHVLNLMKLRDVIHASKPNINTPEYWDKEWAKRKERILPFYKLIADQVNGHKALDFGCGRGDLLKMLGPKAKGMDISKRAVDICKRRGLKASTGSKIRKNARYDMIVATEVLEHVDDDKGLLEHFFEHTDEVFYSVPDNCLPPGLEPEHRRVYSPNYIKMITPHLQSILLTHNYYLVHAKRKE
jgi:hypothetical protein